MSHHAKHKPIHSDIHVVHAVPGRIRLRAHKVRGHPQHAQEVARRLSAVQGIHKADVNPTTGSIIVHYHPSVLDSVEFFAEVAGALGMIAAGLEPSEVEALFKVFGISPTDLRASGAGGIMRDIAVPLAIIAVGFLARQRFG